MNTARAANAYSQVGVETGVTAASPHQLILMLFEGAVRAVAKARIALKNNDVPAKCEAISKAISIIQEGLQLSLDVKAGGEIAQNLNDLYEYMTFRLLVANTKNDSAALDEVGRLLIDLKGAWDAIGKQQAQQPAAQPQPTQAPAAEPQSQAQRAALSYGKV